jgi:D-alanyl-D-alanine carboxypeptidase
MFERFDTIASAKVLRAAELADDEGATTVEAEHLLIALVDPVDDPVGEMLIASGITGAAISEARDREYQSALASVGVPTSRSAPAGAARLRRGRSTRFGQSAKLAIERTIDQLARTHGRRVTSEHLLRAIISADVGVTPRLLAELGTTREELTALLDGL